MKPVIGTVVSNKMQKSVVVAVDRLFHNKLYNRYVKRTSKFSFLHLISLPLFEIVFDLVKSGNFCDGLVKKLRLLAW